MKKITVFICFIMLFGVFATASAQDSKYSKFEDLIPVIESLEARIAALEAQLTPGVTKATWSGSDLASANSDDVFGNYVIHIDRYKLNKTRDGKNALTIFFTFTNNSQETKSFDALYLTAFQNGVEIEKVYESNFYHNHDKSIRPGISIDASTSFEIEDTENQVELEITEAFSWSSDTKLYVLDLSKAER